MPGFAISREGISARAGPRFASRGRKNEMVEGGCLSRVLRAVGLSAGRGVRMIRSVLESRLVPADSV